MFGAGNRRPRVTGITVVSKRDFNEASNDFHCLQEKKKENTTNESRFFSANREEFQREKSEKGRVLSADVCTRCL